jgi:hypothetical protein
MVPADTMFFVSYLDAYGQSWLPVQEQLDDFEFEDGRLLDDFMEEFRKETGLDLEGDILELLTGEIALAGNFDLSDESPEVKVIGLAEVTTWIMRRILSMPLKSTSSGKGSSPETAMVTSTSGRPLMSQDSMGSGSWCVTGG